MPERGRTDPAGGGRSVAPHQHGAIVTGLSGAGKTATSKIFEDLGYTVIDNVPSAFAIRWVAENMT